MARATRSGISRIGVIIAVLIGCVVLAGGGYFAHKWRKAMLVEEAHRVGLAAYDEQDWETARQKLGYYLAVNKEDTDALRKYAHAQLAIQPLPQANIAQAIGAYRGLFRLDPADQEAYDRLALLYRTTGNSAELGYVAETHLEALPDDPAARLDECRVLSMQQKPAEARQCLEDLVADLYTDPAAKQVLVEASLVLAEIILQTPGENAPRSALAVLDAAAETPGANTGLLHAFRAAIFTGLARQESDQMAAHLDDARAALALAEEQAGDDARAWVTIAQEWIRLGGHDRADDALETARALPHRAVHAHYVDLDDFNVACTLAEGELCLSAQQADRGAQLADDALAAFENERHHVAILPTAVRLYTAAGRVEDARASLDEYIDILRTSGVSLTENPTITMLRAIVADAEDRPFEVITQLEPLVRRGAANLLAVQMLVDAYRETGQQGRVAAVLGELPPTQSLPAPLQIRLAQAAIRNSEWSRALELLSAFDTTQSVDLALVEVSAAAGLALESGTADTEFPALVARLEDLRAANPERSDLRVLLATIHSLRDDPDAAQRELEQATQEVADPLPAYLALASLHSTAGRTQEALATLETACDQYGNTAEPWLRRAALLATDNQFDPARDVLSQGRAAVTAAEERLQIDIRLALTDLVADNADEGLAKLEQLAAENPENAAIRDLLLQSPQVLRQEASATQYVDQLREIEGETGLAWRLGQARVWLANPDWARHIEDLETNLRYCIEADPTSAEAILLLGEAYERQGRLDDAERTYYAGLETGGATTVINRLLNLLQRQRRFDEVRQLLDRTQDRLGQQNTAARRLALAMETGAIDDAYAELQMRATQGDRQPLDLLQLATLTYARGGDAEQAMAYVDEAAELGAAPSDVARVRASILVTENRPDEAEQVLNDLVAAEETPAALLLRASFYLNRQQPEKAQQDFERLATLAGDEMGAAALGEFYASRGNMDAAIAEWDNGLKAYPDSVRLRRGLCKALLARGGAADLARVSTLLDELRDLQGQENVEWLWLEALRLARIDFQKYRDRIATLVERSLNAIPAGGAEAFNGLAELAIQLGNLQTARAIVQRGLEFYVRDRDLQFEQARVELLVGNADAAAQFANRLLSQEPGSTDALRILAAAAEREDSDALFQQALDIIDARLTENADNPDLQMLRSQVLTAMGQPAAAVESLETYLPQTSGPVRTAVLLDLARLYQGLEQPEKADQYIDQAYAEAPDAPNVLLAKMRRWADRREFQQIADLAEQLSTQDAPNFPVVLEAAGLLLRAPEYHPNVKRLCERVASALPDNSAALMAIGEMLFSLGDSVAAESAFRHVLELRPGFIEAQNNVAWIVATKAAPTPAELEEARTFAQAVVQQAPDDANYRDTLATVLRRLGDLTAARREFQRVAQLAADNSAAEAHALLNLASVCDELEDNAAARQHLDQALAVRDALQANGRGPVFSPDQQAEIDRLQQALP